MVKRTLTAGAVVLTAICAFQGPTALGTPQAVLAAEQATASPAQPASPKMGDMSKMHEQMMAEMKAADAKLDQLVSAMNAASGEAKVTALAQVVNELVRQQKAMHEHMGMMAQHMGGGMAGKMPMKK